MALSQQFPALPIVLNIQGKGGSLSAYTYMSFPRSPPHPHSYSLCTTSSSTFLLVHSLALSSFTSSSSSSLLPSSWSLPSIFSWSPSCCCFFSLSSPHYCVSTLFGQNSCRAWVRLYGPNCIASVVALLSLRCVPHPLRQRIIRLDFAASAQVYSTSRGPRMIV